MSAKQDDDLPDLPEIPMLDRGTYRLCCEVRNPRPDRRANQHRIANWHQWATWGAGTIFIVDTMGIPGTTARINRLYVRGGYSSNALFSRDLAWSAIVPNLEPVTETASDYLERCYGSMAGGYALTILDKLQIPQSEIERAITLIEADEAGLA